MNVVSLLNFDLSFGIDAQVMMYKNSPPELQESVLVMLRGALLSGIRTCNELVNDDDAFADIGVIGEGCFNFT